MKKKILYGVVMLGVLIGVMMGGTPTAMAGDLIIEDNMVTGYTGDPVDLVIPDGVLGISDYAFEDCLTLETVEMPDSVTSIGESAFCGCAVLRSVEMSDEMHTIGSFAFSNCSSLASITIPEKVKVINDFAFMLCVELTSVTFEGTFTEIGTFAFSNCQKLESVTLQGDDLVISDFAFQNCYALQTVDVTGGITEIKMYTFQQCTSLRSVSLSCNDAVIDMWVFDECTSLTEVNISGTVTGLGIYAFKDCIKLTDITIPMKDASIGIFAFMNCYNLSHVKFEGSVSILSDFAFLNCKKLTSVEFPAGLMDYGLNTFTGCVSLETLILPEGMTTIGSGLFDGCTGLKNIVLPHSITSIQRNAFKGCASLTSIILPDGLTEIGESAFQNCSRLESIVIPDGVSRIEPRTFLNCRSLKRIDIPAAVVFIDATAFVGCHEDLSIYASPESYAADFAHDHGISLNGQPVVMYESQATIGNSQFGVQIIDHESRCGIEGAQVTIAGLGTVYSNADGYAIFEDVNFESSTECDVNIVVNEDYFNAERSMKVFGGRVVCTYVFRKSIIPTAGKFYDAETGEDILYADRTVYENDGAEKEYIMEGHCSSYAISEYRIIQNGIIRFRNSSGVFDIDFSRDFDAGYRIYVQVVDINGNTSAPQEIGLKVKTKPSDFSLLGSYTLSLELKKSIKEEPPFIGGTSIEFGSPDILPLIIDIKDNVFEIYIGMSAEDLSVDNKAWIKALAKKDKKLSKLDANKPFKAGYGELTYSLYGYGKGYIQDGVLQAVSVDMVINVGGEYVYTWYFFPGGIPVYAQLGGGGEMDSRFEHKLNCINGKWIPDFGYMEMELKVFLKAGAGVGVAGYLNVGLEGEIDLDYRTVLQENYDRVTATIEGSVVANAIIFEYKQSFAKQTWVLYEGYEESKWEQNAGYMPQRDKPGVDIYSKDNYTFTHRKTISSALTAKSMTDKTVVENDTFGNPMPKLIQHNGMPYFFWLTDNKARDEKNRSMLVYSKQVGGVWTSPTAIEDDGTADFNFDIASDGDDVYLVWQDSRTMISGTEEPEMEDYAAISEISFATLDTTSGVMTSQQLTENTGLDAYPRIAKKGDQVLICWVSNDASDYFLNTGTNTVYSVLMEDGVFGEPTVVVSTDEAVADLDAGFLNDDYYVAYSLDTDCDFSTSADREIYYQENMEDAAKLTDNEVIDSKPYFAEFDGDDYLFWYSNGNIYYTDSIGDTPTAIFAANDTGVSDQIEVVEGDGAVKMIWNGTIKGNTEITTGVFASNLNDDGTWSLPYLLSETGHMASLPSGYMDGSEAVLGYSRVAADITGVVFGNSN